MQDKLKVACVRASPTRYFFARDGGVIIMLIITTRRAKLICHDLFSLSPLFRLDIHISVLNILMAIMPNSIFIAWGFRFSKSKYYYFSFSKPTGNRLFMNKANQQYTVLFHIVCPYWHHNNYNCIK